MKEMYAQLGISSEVYDFGKKIEYSLKERFEKFDQTAEYNQMKVIHAMQKHVSELPPDMATMTLAEKPWSRFMQILFIQKPAWFAHRLPAEPMHWLLPCSEIYVRAMSCFPQSENHMIPWKKLSESVNPMALLLNTV